MALAHLFVLTLGGGLVLTPIVLHLLMKPKPKPFVFPALRFLRESAVSNRRQLRLRQWLLLLLRCLVILLLAAALAGPAVAANDFGKWISTGGTGFLLAIISLVLLSGWFREKRNLFLLAPLAAIWIGLACWFGWSLGQAMSAESEQILGQSEAPVSALFIVDTSPRMSYRHENQTHLGRATEMANWTIQQLPPESQIAVADSRDDQPFFSVDASAAKKRIATLELNYTSLAIPEVLYRGLKLLEQSAHERREIYIITDLTRQSWTSQRTQQIRDQLEKLSGVSLFVIDVGTSSITNLSLAAPKLHSSVLAANSGLRMTADISRIGPPVERTVELLIEKPDDTRPMIQDGKTIVPDQFWRLTQNVNVAENGSGSTEFLFAEPLPPGIHHGKLVISGTDGLMLDNERFFTVDVREAWQVLVICPKDVNPANLIQTISPPIDGRPNSSMFQCTLKSPEETSQIDLSQFQAVFLLDPEPIEDAFWKQLRDYVSAGGGLGVFLGNHALLAPGAEPRFVSTAAQSVLGGKLTIPWRRSEGNLFLSPQNLAHPIFEPFRAIATSIAWSEFPIYMHWGIELPENPESPIQVILRYGNQQPALVEHVIGLGRVLVMTTPNTEPSRPVGGRSPWNGLFVGRPLPAWLLTRQIAFYLVQIESDTLNIETGQLAVLKNDLRIQPEIYTLYSPKLDQSTTKIVSVGNQVRYKFTDMPGQFRIKGNLNGPIIRGFSVNMRPADTDLTRIESAELDGFLGKDKYQLAVDRGQIQRQQGTSRKGQEFYPLLVIMLTVIFAIEYLMANRFYSIAQPTGAS